MKTSKLRSRAERLQNLDDVSKIAFSSKRPQNFVDWSSQGIRFLGFVLGVFHRFEEEFLYPVYTKLFRSMSCSYDQNRAPVGAS